MGKRIVFGENDEVTATPTLPEEHVVENHDDSSDNESVEEQSARIPPRRGFAGDYDSDDSDEAPEEVSVATSKGKTMELYEVQKNAAKQ